MLDGNTLLWLVMEASFEYKPLMIGWKAKALSGIIRNHPVSSQCPAFINVSITKKK